MFAQSYSAILKNLRRQAKVLFVWYPKDRADLKMIHAENDVLTDGKLVIGRNLLKTSKDACLFTQKDNPCGFKALNHV